MGQTGRDQHTQALCLSLFCLTVMMPSSISHIHKETIIIFLFVEEERFLLVFDPLCINLKFSPDLNKRTYLNLSRFFIYCFLTWDNLFKNDKKRLWVLHNHFIWILPLLLGASAISRASSRPVLCQQGHLHQSGATPRCFGLSAARGVYLHPEGAPQQSSWEHHGGDSAGHQRGSRKGGKTS